MDTSSVENGVITRSDLPLRVINSTPEAIAKAKSRVKRSFKQIRTENVFRRSLTIIGLIMVILVAGILLTLIVQSMPSIQALGPKYLWGRVWDPVQDVYGALP